MVVKVVQWQGSINPVYEEIGELELKELIVGNNESEELCIELEDLLKFLRLQ